MTALIEIKDISKKYLRGQQAVYALQQISLTINKGDIFGIIGQSGAGKSTLIRSLASLAIPDSGQILFNGSDIRNLKGQALRGHRKQIGMIFQHFNLLSSRTAAGNIAYPLEIAGISQEVIHKRVEELLSIVGLQNKGGAYPSQLSGGEKQRVGIARAIANNPQVLLCDEATSALDPGTTQEILELLQKINRELGVTIVLITHEMEVIKKICNKVAVLEGGKMVEVGSVYQVFSNPLHATTVRLLQNTPHELPPLFFQNSSANRKLLQLRFTGCSAGEPIISMLVHKYGVEANILQGWIDHLKEGIVGTLTIELIGPPEKLQAAQQFLSEKEVHYEVLEK